MVYLSDYFEINESQIPTDLIDPAYRKATANMIGAVDVCKKSISTLNEEEKKSLSFIVATHFGEVSSSLEFLTTLHDQKIAKPILFQNSLHNSTLGFASIQLGLTGPAFTISADKNTDQAVSKTAKSLLHLSDTVLICYVDIVPDFLKKNYGICFPEIEPHLGWARSFLISKNNHHCNSPVPITLDNFIFSAFLKNQKKP
ncbi:MAG: beta-ketoacyl synthase chain length factor [Pseudobdellovibrio sp.]